MTFVDFLNSFRETIPYKVLGIMSSIIVPITALVSTQSMVRYNNELISEHIFILQLLWIYILFPALIIILSVLFIVLTLFAIKSVKKVDYRTAKSNKIADIGFIICLSYLIYCLIFYVIIIPTGLSAVKEGIDYINTESQNFYSSDDNKNIDNLCVSSRVNALNCFAKHIPGGKLDKEYKYNVISTFDRIYYFKPMLIKGEHLNPSLLQNAEVLVSDKFKIIAPKSVIRIYGNYLYNKNSNKQQITGYRFE